MAAMPRPGMGSQLDVSLDDLISKNNAGGGGRGRGTGRSARPAYGSAESLARHYPISEMLGASGPQFSGVGGLNWTCVHCTFSNDKPYAPVCAMCQTPRSTLHGMPRNNNAGVDWRGATGPFSLAGPLILAGPGPVTPPQPPQLLPGTTAGVGGFSPTPMPRFGLPALGDGPNLGVPALGTMGSPGWTHHVAAARHEPPVLQQHTWWTCPRCAWNNKAEATLCSSCHRARAAMSPFTRAPIIRVWMRAHMHMCSSAHMCVHVLACASACVRTCVHLCVRACECVLANIFLRARTRCLLGMFGPAMACRARQVYRWTSTQNRLCLLVLQVQHRCGMCEL